MTKKKEGIEFQCVYCREKWTIPFNELVDLTDMPRCPNSTIERGGKCGGFGVATSATIKGLNK